MKLVNHYKIGSKTALRLGLALTQEVDSTVWLSLLKNVFTGSKNLFLHLQAQLFLHLLIEELQNFGLLDEAPKVLLIELILEAGRYFVEDFFVSGFFLLFQLIDV